MVVHARVLYLSILNGTASVAIYDPLGHNIAGDKQGSGTKTYDLRRSGRGLYIVRVKGDRVNTTQRVVVD